MRDRSRKRAALGLVLLMSAGSILTVQAEEYGYENEYEERAQAGDDWAEVYSDRMDEDTAAESDIGIEIFTEEGSEEEDGSGIGYSVPEGWMANDALDADGAIVYRSDDFADSTITCSYLDTNYSIQEYEQLRDMLTNNLLYEHVDAQISTSAVYTLSKDYLYIILVDDAADSYREIYNYVVGDYRCFLADVKESRADVDQGVPQDLMTPREAGQSIAESFTWTN